MMRRRTITHKHTHVLQTGDVVIIRKCVIFQYEQLGVGAQKGPLWPESLSYQKKDGRVTVHPTFDMTPTISFFF